MTICKKCSYPRFYNHLRLNKFILRFVYSIKCRFRRAIGNLAVLSITWESLYMSKVLVSLILVIICLSPSVMGNDKKSDNLPNPERIDKLVDIGTHKLRVVISHLNFLATINSYLYY